MFVGGSVLIHGFTNERLAAHGPAQTLGAALAERQQRRLSKEGAALPSARAAPPASRGAAPWGCRAPCPRPCAAWSTPPGGRPETSRRSSSARPCWCAGPGGLEAVGKGGGVVGAGVVVGGMRGRSASALVVRAPLLVRRTCGDGWACGGRSEVGWRGRPPPASLPKPITKPPTALTHTPRPPAPHLQRDLCGLVRPLTRQTAHPHTQGPHQPPPSRPPAPLARIPWGLASPTCNLVGTRL